MQTGSSETLIGWKSGKPLLSLYGTKWRERGCGPSTHRKTEKERQLADEDGKEGVGEESNHTSARKPGPVLIIQYSLVNSHEERCVTHTLIKK
jgi:hypothetical protein